MANRFLGRRVYGWIVLGHACLWGCSASVDTANSRSNGAASGASGRTGSVGNGDAGSAGGGSGVYQTPTGKPIVPTQAGGAPTPSTGSGAPGSDSSCAAISQVAENQRKPADIIIAVDNSGSMSEEIAFVRERLNGFSQQITDSGVDVRIILISSPYPRPMTSGGFWDDDDDDEDNGICIAAPLGSGQCPEDSQAPRYFHVAQEVKSHDALDLFISTYPSWQAQLRPNSNKTFVVVTDDNAEKGANSSAAAFTQSVAGLPGGNFASWSFSGIFCFSDCPDAAEIGTVYQDLVQQTSGVAGDLCEQNFAPVFDALAKAVVSAAGLDCSWEIPAPPAGQTFDRERVNVQYATQGNPASALPRVNDAAACGMRSAWHYDNPAAPQRILMCPSACSALQNDLQAKVDVLFGCQTQLAPD